MHQFINETLKRQILSLANQSLILQKIITNLNSEIRVMIDTTQIEKQ